jgi:hypothetical protein
VAPSEASQLEGARNMMRFWLAGFHSVNLWVSLPSRDLCVTQRSHDQGAIM